MRRGSFMLPPATSGGPRRCKASLWLQPRAPQLPALGRIHFAQGGAKPAFGHRPRQAAVTAFGPYLFSGSIRKTSAIEIKGFPARPESILSCNRRRQRRRSSSYERRLSRSATGSRRVGGSADRADLLFLQFRSASGPADPETRSDPKPTG